MRVTLVIAAVLGLAGLAVWGAASAQTQTDRYLWASWVGQHPSNVYGGHTFFSYLREKLKVDGVRLAGPSRKEETSCAWEKVERTNANRMDGFWNVNETWVFVRGKCPGYSEGVLQGFVFHVIFGYRVSAYRLGSDVNSPQHFVCFERVDSPELGGAKWYVNETEFERGTRRPTCSNSASVSAVASRIRPPPPPPPSSRPTYSCHDQCRGGGPADPTARAAVYDMCMRSCTGSP